MADENAILNEVADALDELEEDKLLELVRQSLSLGIDANNIVAYGLVPGMVKVGERYERREYFVPELLLASDITDSAMSILSSQLDDAEKSGEKSVVVVIGTVQGDIHQIGKDVVAQILGANGYTVHNLGVNVPSQSFIDKALEVDADVIGLSALMSTTMTRMEEVINLAKAQGVRERFKIVIGGAPVDNKYASHIGADGYSKDAAGAVRLIKELTGNN